MLPTEQADPAGNVGVYATVVRPVLSWVSRPVVKHMIGDTR